MVTTVLFSAILAVSHFHETAAEAVADDKIQQGVVGGTVIENSNSMGTVLDPDDETSTIAAATTVADLPLAWLWFWRLFVSLVIAGVIHGALITLLIPVIKGDFGRSWRNILDAPISTHNDEPFLIHSDNDLPRDLLLDEILVEAHTTKTANQASQMPCPVTREAGTGDSIDNFCARAPAGEGEEVQNAEDIISTIGTSKDGGATIVEITTTTTVVEIKSNGGTIERGNTTSPSPSLPSGSIEKSTAKQPKGLATTSKTAAKLRTAQEATPTQTPAPPPTVFRSSSNLHPGLDAFWYWCDTECSLFRIYTIERNDGIPAVPPYNASSRRGTVPIDLRVTNGFSTSMQWRQSHRPSHTTTSAAQGGSSDRQASLSTPPNIAAYWIDYKGKEVFKGFIRPGMEWTQTTWIDHPWVFRMVDSAASPSMTPHDQGIPLLHYIPYRVIPTTPEAPTASLHDDIDPSFRVGIHRFTILSSLPFHSNNTYHHSSSIYRCCVNDPIMPYPARDAFINIMDAVDWTLIHCYRMNYMGWNVLKKYMRNVIQYPTKSQYRHIRIANKYFATNVWNTPARGILLAIGCIDYGDHVELGTTDPLPLGRIRDIANVLVKIDEYQQRHEQGGGWDDPQRQGGQQQQQQQQPAGADGSGRAGYGRGMFGE